MDDKQLVTTTPGDFDALKALVIDGLNSPHSKTMYALAIDDFIAWYQAQGKPGLTKAAVNAYKAHLQQNTDYAPSTINQRLSAIRKLAREAADNELISEPQANGIGKVKGIPARGVRTGNWLTHEQAQRLIKAPDTSRLKGIRDRAILSVMIGMALRRSEVVKLDFEHIQLEKSRWVIRNLVSKGNRVRTIGIPTWVKRAIDEWTQAAGVTDGKIFRSINKGDNLSGDSMTSQAVQNIVKEYAAICGFNIAAHDLRRTTAKQMKEEGADTEQIQFMLGHASLPTTQRYLGTMQDLTNAPNDLLHFDID